MRFHSLNILAAIAFALLLAPDAAARKKSAAAPARAPALRANLSVEQIDARIAALESEIASLSATIARLRSDSAAVATQRVQALDAARAKMSEIDGWIGGETQTLNGLLAQREEMRRDSLGRWKENSSTRSEYGRNLAALEKKIVALSSELYKLSQRREQLARDDGSGGERTLAQVKADAARHDSLIAGRQTSLSSLKQRYEQARQDSLTGEGAAATRRGQLRLERRASDSILAVSDASVKQAFDEMAAVRADSASEQKRQKQTLSELSGAGGLLRSRAATIDQELASASASARASGERCWSYCFCSVPAAFCC